MSGYVDDVVIPYDRELGPVLFEHYGKAIAQRVAASEPRDVLEVAAGTGIATRHLRSLIPQDAKLTAIDISDSMMEIARAKFSPEEQVTFQIADATMLPFDDGSFDAVVCQFGVMFFDREPAFREVYRSLRRGGRYLFSVWDSAQYNPFASLSFDVLKQFFPMDTPRFLFEPVAAHPIDPIKEQLIRTGFDSLVISVQRHVHEIHDVSAFARALIYSPVLFEIQNRGGNPEEIAELLAETIRKEFGETPARYPMQAIVYETEKG